MEAEGEDEEVVVVVVVAVPSCKLAVGKPASVSHCFLCKLPGAVGYLLQ